jgi:hypothetical protein
MGTDHQYQCFLSVLSFERINQRQNQCYDDYPTQEIVQMNSACIGGMSL